MRKIHMLMLAAAAIVSVATAATYSVISVTEPGAFYPAGIGVGKLSHIQVVGAYPTNGTFIVSRISDDGAVTNALFTRTPNEGGWISDEIGTGTNIWIMAGDKLLRGGTVTNVCRCRLILTGGD